MRLTANMVVTAMALLVAFLAQRVQGHAYLVYPASRNYLASTPKVSPNPSNRFYCPACGQGNFPVSRPGICGDPFQNVGDKKDPFQRGFNFKKLFYGYTDLKKGSIIKISVAFVTNHGGRMQVGLCNKKASEATQDCFEKNLLRRHHPGNSQYDKKFYWYLKPATKSGDTISEYYQLPKDFSCPDGCILQWSYYAYQVCSAPCKRANVDVPSECGKNLVNPIPKQCHDFSKIEKYYNCADVRIR